MKGPQNQGNVAVSNQADQNVSDTVTKQAELCHRLAMRQLQRVVLDSLLNQHANTAIKLVKCFSECGFCDVRPLFGKIHIKTVVGEFKRNPNLFSRYSAHCSSDELRQFEFLKESHELKRVAASAHGAENVAQDL